MALQKSITKFGMEFPEAYHKIFFCGLENNSGNIKTCRVGIKVWTSANYKEQDPYEIHVGHYDTTIDITSPDGILNQVYTYLKTLIEFSGAIDV